MFTILITALFLQGQSTAAQEAPPPPPPPPLAAMVSQGSVAASQVADVTARDVNAVLDRMHDAASRGDEETYFAQFATGARFIGTDAAERWDMGQFRQYAHPIFASGRGWTYHPRPDRTLMITGDTVVFDEVLDHATYGVLRGSGVVRRETDGWKIEQYVLSFAVPNAVADDVVALIKAHPEPTAAPAQ